MARRPVLRNAMLDLRIQISIYHACSLIGHSLFDRGLLKLGVLTLTESSVSYSHMTE